MDVISIKNRIPCPDCTRTYANEITLRKHLDLDHKKQLIHPNMNIPICEYCGVFFNTFYELDIHIGEHKTKNNQDLYCDDCELQFELDLDYKRHIRKHEKRNLKCTHKNCNKTYTDYNNLNDHIQSVHLKIKLKCSIKDCEVICSSDLNLSTHEKTHSNYQKFPCTFKNYDGYEDCELLFNNRQARSQHIKRIHNKITIQCPYCQTKVKNRIDQHIGRKHSDKKAPKQYFCNEDNCKYVGDTPEKVKSHKLHSHQIGDLIEIECQHLIDGIECGKIFNSHSNYTSHEEQVHFKIKNFSCDSCPSKFYDKADLLKHIRTHTGEYPFVCKKLDVYTLEQCEYKARQKSNLSIHDANHHSEEAKRKKKTYEESIFKALRERGYKFEREQVIQFNCISSDKAYARLDGIYYTKNVIIILEIDEYQHESYPVICEINRMLTFQAVQEINNNSLPILWIRFNPNEYIVDFEEHEFLGKKERVNEIIRIIVNSQKQAYTKKMNLLYMYYDIEDKNPCISYLPEFDSIRDCILPSVF